MFTAAFISATPLPLLRAPAPLTPLTRPYSPLPLRVSRTRLHVSAPRVTPAASADPPSFKQHAHTFLQNASKVAAVAALSLMLLSPDASLAASAGGRMGGSSFRAPSRSAPSYTPRSYAPSPPVTGYGYGYGYGAPSIFMNPFIAPVGVGLGFGGLGTFIALALAASFISSLVRSASTTSGGVDVAQDPTTTVALLKVGLLSSARTLQVDLDALARSADTSTVSGLSTVLSNTATSLLRHPDYWSHSSISVAAEPFSRAEAAFSRAALDQRLNLGEETLVNTSGVRAEAERASASSSDMSKAPGEYIVVVLVVAAAGQLIKRLPKDADSVSKVEKALRALATVGTDELQAVEVIWAPQSLRDTLSEREMLTDHPDLKLL